METLYMADYTNSEESEYEDQEGSITGKEKESVGYAKRKFLWVRTNLTGIKGKLYRAHHNNLTPHARAMAKPSHSGGISSRPAPDGPTWPVRQQVSTD